MENVQALASEILQDPSYGAPWPGKWMIGQVILSRNGWHLSPKQRKLARGRASSIMAVIRHAYRRHGLHFETASTCSAMRRLEALHLACLRSFPRAWDGQPTMRGCISHEFGGDGYFKVPRGDLPLGQWVLAQWATPSASSSKPAQGWLSARSTSSVTWLRLGFSQ